MLQIKSGPENLTCQNQNPESKLYIMRNKKKRGFWCGILIEDTYLYKMLVYVEWFW